jgi:single-strand DNA-binding protein
MRGIYIVTLVGNVGKEPEVNVLEGNICVAKFSLARTEMYKDNKGAMQTQTEWHNIVLWRGLAELAQKYITKGSLLFIEGKLKTRHYDDKDGARKYVTEIVADEMIMLDKRKDENA